jgi:hypothetical protein
MIGFIVVVAVTMVIFQQVALSRSYDKAEKFQREALYWTKQACYWQAECEELCERLAKQVVKQAIPPAPHSDLN